MPLLKWSINILIDSESVGPDRGSPNGSGRRIYCGDESTSDSKLKTWELVYPNLRILGSRVTSLTRKICHSNDDHIMLTLSFMYCIPREIPPKTWTPERSWYDRTPETMCSRIFMLYRDRNQMPLKMHEFNLMSSQPTSCPHHHHHPSPAGHRSIWIVICLASQELQRHL